MCTISWCFRDTSSYVLSLHSLTVNSLGKLEWLNWAHFCHLTMNEQWNRSSQGHSSLSFTSGPCLAISNYRLSTKYHILSFLTDLYPYRLWSSHRRKWYYPICWISDFGSHSSRQLSCCGIVEHVIVFFVLRLWYIGQYQCVRQMISLLGLVCFPCLILF